MGKCTYTIMVSNNQIWTRKTSERLLNATYFMSRGYSSTSNAVKEISPTLFLIIHLRTWVKSVCRKINKSFCNGSVTVFSLLFINVLHSSLLSIDVSLFLFAKKAGITSVQVTQLGCLFCSKGFHNTCYGKLSCSKYDGPTTLLPIAS